MTLIITMAWRNLWRHPRRTLFTLLAIAFATAILVFGVSLQQGIYRAMIDAAAGIFQGQLQIQPRGYLERPDIHRVIHHPDLVSRAILPVIRGGAVAIRATGFALAASGERSYGVQIVGVQSDREPNVSVIPHVMKQGRYLTTADTQAAVIGHILARNLKLKLGDDLTLYGQGRDGSVAATVLNVVGIFVSGANELDRQLIEMPLPIFQEVFSMGDAAHALVVSGTHSGEIHAMANVIRSQLDPQWGLAVLTWDQLVPGVKQIIRLNMAFGWFIYLVLVCIVIFGILNTLLMSVLERTREFGTMLALGAKPGRISGLILTESFLLTLVGLGIGIVLGAAVTEYYILRGFVIPGDGQIATKFNLPNTIQPDLSIISLSVGPAVIMIASLLVTIYPALRIRWLGPLDAM